MHADKSAANICKLRQWRSQQPSCLDYIVLDDRLSVIDCNIICECSVTATREGSPLVQLKQPATQILTAFLLQRRRWDRPLGTVHFAASKCQLIQLFAKKDITCAARSRNVRPMSLGQRSNNMSHRILRTCCSSLRTAKILRWIFVFMDPNPYMSHSQNTPWRNEDLANISVEKRKKLCLATGPSQKRHPHVLSYLMYSHRQNYRKKKVTLSRQVTGKKRWPRWSQKCK